MKRFISLATSFVMFLTVIFCIPLPATPVHAVDFKGAVAYQQGDSRWGSHVWKSQGTQYTIAGSACGILSLINAMNYKTGVFLQPIEVADWANANGFGTSAGIGNGVGAGQFYSEAAKKYGYTYVCAAQSVADMLSYVRSGYAACVCIPGHWVAVVDYDASTDMYLLLDSARGSSARANLILKSAYTKAERFDSGAWTGVAWVKSNLFNVTPETGNYGLNGHAMAILSFSPRSPLNVPKMSTNKEKYIIGDTVDISWEPSPSDSNLSHYWIVIDGPDGNVVNSTMNLNTSYSFKPSRTGTYYITTFATPKGSLEGEGSLTDSKTIEVEELSWRCELSESTVYLDMDSPSEKSITLTVYGRISETQLEIDDAGLVKWDYSGQRDDTHAIITFKFTPKKIGDGICSFIVKKNGTIVNKADVNVHVCGSYDITFDSNGGSSLSKKTVKHGSTYGTLPVPSKSGYVFDGWYTENEKQITSSSIADINHGTVLYARWKNISHKLTFDPNGGSGTSETIDYADSGLVDAPIKPVMEGYVLAGWSEKKYSPKKSIRAIDGKIIFSEFESRKSPFYMYLMEENPTSVTQELILNKDTTLYAIWIKKPTEFSHEWYGDVNFDGSIGVFDFSRIKEYYYNYTELDELQKKYADLNGDGKINIDDMDLIHNIIFNGINGENVREAIKQWLKTYPEENTYTITFNANGGKIFEKGTTYEEMYSSGYDIRSKAYSYESFDGNYIIPYKAMRTGYYFQGWYTEKEGGVRVSENSVAEKRNTTLYAHWANDILYYDMNNDDEFSVSDIVLFTKYVFGQRVTSDNNLWCADRNFDGKLTIIDLILFKAMLWDYLQNG